MTGRETSAGQRATIAALAVEAFAKHALTWDAATMSWTCGADSFAYAFRLYTAPGVVAVWGDIGEFMLRHSAEDSMGWLLTQGRKEERYPDYFLEKLTACRGEKREFFIGDAFEYIKERIEEEDDPARVARWRSARSDLRDYLASEDCAPVDCWRRAYIEATHDGDVPECDGWSPGPLWLWHAVHCFTRLYDARPAQGAAA